MECGEAAGANQRHAQTSKEIPLSRLPFSQVSVSFCVAPSLSRHAEEMTACNGKHFLSKYFYFASICFMFHVLLFSFQIFLELNPIADVFHGNELSLQNGPTYSL